MRTWALLVITACSTERVVTSCPPAPFRFDDGGTKCDFAGECGYYAPVFVGTPDEDPCNGRGCVCCTAVDAGVGCAPPTSANRMVCLDGLIGCTAKVKVCPSDAHDGASCTFADAGLVIGNAECLVLGAGADLSKGIVNGQACACDFPGPIWRCLTAATTAPQ